MRCHCCNSAYKTRLDKPTGRFYCPQCRSSWRSQVKEFELDWRSHKDFNQEGSETPLLEANDDRTNPIELDVLRKKYSRVIDEEDYD